LENSFKQAAGNNPLPKHSILLYAGESVQIYCPRVFIIAIENKNSPEINGVEYVSL
jgi:hypothetical protein